ncbi:hypothetical protein BO70DRAFT_417162 [Aspergillus heteromorphus CBS 117.55]|uniref:Uncharacterized protein n=1 Tax=Aspergillus heteromorphus CBS 117.55 TaxID=1448321 RepID=A0A317V703_9EURO|nr:uncharacterized protein BO70DRAFT_417162 [Aspergillus heteromorphus CBS 117.55]PWY68612.1 hypothetical protein BO70DRAFT_417162 [Aspergillus heteromorphus CBS 117.55]
MVVDSDLVEREQPPHLLVILSRISYLRVHDHFLFSHSYQRKSYSSRPCYTCMVIKDTASSFNVPDTYDMDGRICQLDATNGRSHAVVAAGPIHHGAFVDYLTNCGSICKNVDQNKKSLILQDQRHRYS